MTFFENMRNLEREKEENQYPKDVHTQWDLKYNIQNRELLQEMAFDNIILTAYKDHLPKKRCHVSEIVALWENRLKTTVDIVFDLSI